MLSVLIPTYNYEVVNLVTVLYEQLNRQSVLFEIICYDNGSKGETNQLNEKINKLKNVTFNALQKDTGRSRVRNQLAEDSKYDWLLFLDADVMPVDNDFIKRYLDAVKLNDGHIFYGGLKYSDLKPDKDIRLRWVYGNKREAISAEVRKDDKKIHFASGNFLISKKAFNSVRFNEDLIQYGYEDFLMAVELAEKGYQIVQIDNPVYHLGLDKNEIFIEKTQKAVENLWFLYKEKKMDARNSDLIRVYERISSSGLENFSRGLLKPLLNSMEINLRSGEPLLWIYDLYKLGYLLNFIKK